MAGDMQFQDAAAQGKLLRTKLVIPEDVAQFMASQVG
jgi:hypothetical protein